MANCRTIMTALFCLLLIACSDSDEGSPVFQLPPLEITDWSPGVVLDGGKIVIKGNGFLPAALVTYRIFLDGQLGRFEMSPIFRIDDNTLHYQVGKDFALWLPPGSVFTGNLIVKRILTESGQIDEIVIPLQFQTAANLTPTLATFDSSDGVLYPGDVVDIMGDGFLLPGEGHTIVQFSGTYKTPVPPETRPISVVVPVNGQTRTYIPFKLTPDIFGIRPGVFQGAILVTNEALAGQQAGQGLANVLREIKPPFINLVEPTTVSRGQRLLLSGRGFLETDPLYETTTLIRLEGEFQAARTSAIVDLAGPSALALFPDAFQTNQVMEYILRVSQTPSGDQTGLGLISGSFSGSVSPMLVSGSETILGDPYPVQLNISPQRQVVHVNFLPGFSDTVEEMGLGPVETNIKMRILDVCARDYTNVNIEFRAEKPSDFIEYSVIEVGGTDPNQAGLFGLDNTKGKDVGNLRFNDVIGGTNAETAKQGYFAYGGVFVKSFFQLSPTLPTSDQTLPIASSAFDEVFGPFMPALGGQPITAAELNSNTARIPQINEAIRVLGNLVGSTVVHEIGHSLGLAAIDGEYHNVGDNPGWIMDAGTYRPFNERAEINGTPPAAFSPNNRSYLERILPTK